MMMGSPIHGMEDMIPQCEEQNFMYDHDEYNYDNCPVKSENSSELSYTDLTPPAPNSSVNSNLMDTQWEDNELSCFLGDEFAGYNYHTKHPTNWGNTEVNMWLQSYINDPQSGINPAEFCAEAFAHLSGQDLYTMNRPTFRLLDEQYGDFIYSAFHQLLRDNAFIAPDGYEVGNHLPVPVKQENFSGFIADAATISFDVNDRFPSIPSFPIADRNGNCKLPPMNTFTHTYEFTVGSDTASEPPSPCSTTGSYDPPKRKHTRAPKGNHLWEFVRDLLMDDRYNPYLIRWEDREQGVFKFVKSDQVAKLWGQKKNNTNMNYEKMSRAMRFCRKEGWFANIPKSSKFPKKLCFSFGPKSSGWKKY